MPQFFLSYATSEEDVATEVVSLLQEKGFTTWHWRRDMVHSRPHPEQTFTQIDESDGFICIVSTDSEHGSFMFPEILRASANKKRFIVILRNLSYSDMQSKFPRWAQAFGFSPAITFSEHEQFSKQVIAAASDVVRCALPSTNTSDRIERRAFQLGRLLHLLNILEGGEAIGRLTSSQVAPVREKTYNFYRLVFDCEPTSQSGSELLPSCERKLLHAKPQVFSAFWVGILWQVFESSHGEVTAIAHLLQTVARDRSQVLAGLPRNHDLFNATKRLYDCAENGNSLAPPHFESCRSALMRYYDES